MASLMSSYEQQYSSLTAEITTKIGRIPNLSGDDKKNTRNNVEKLLEEGSELLEQMDLEVRELSGKERQKYQTRLASYKSELTKLEKELRRSQVAFSDNVHSRNELLGEESHYSEDQRARLLDNSERIERTGRKIEHGYKTVLETEEIGAQVLEDLSSQREQIQRSRQRLRDTNSALGKSSRVLSSMMKRAIQNKVLLFALIISAVVVIAVAIYFSVRKKR